MLPSQKLTPEPPNPLINYSQIKKKKNPQQIFITSSIHRQNKKLFMPFLRQIQSKTKISSRIKNIKTSTLLN